MRDWIQETHICGSFPNLEADDTIGIYATSLYKNNCVLISGDKDFRTIPAWQCCIIDDQIEYIDKKLADKNFCTQVLTGDISDGYKGCAGVGTVKASRILLKPKTLDAMWDAVVQEFLKNGYVVDDVYHQARLARILRADEYDKKTSQPILWKYNYEKYRSIRQSKKSA
jgi:DNA polymerase-1